MAIILVVDDEPTVLSLCVRMLSRSQHEVLRATSGLEALSVLENSSPDLALLDVMMPGMNGIELANRIQDTHPQTKILLMTGVDRREIEKAVGATNTYRILWKPFKTESLTQMVDNVLREPPPRPETA